MTLKPDLFERCERRIDLLEEGDPRAALWVKDFRDLIAIARRTLPLDGDVVERVAIECHHASCANVPRHNPDYSRASYPWEQCPTPAKEAWRAIARAAITATRSGDRELRPVLERVRNGLSAYLPDSKVSTPVSPARLIEIIDAALSSIRDR